VTTVGGDQQDVQVRSGVERALIGLATADAQLVVEVSGVGPAGAAGPPGPSGPAGPPGPAFRYVGPTAPNTTNWNVNDFWYDTSTE
jgi:hypothetical protein